VLSTEVQPVEMRSKTCTVMGLMFAIVLQASFVSGQAAGAERQKAFGRAYDEMYPSREKLRDIRIPGVPDLRSGHVGTSIGIGTMPTFGDMKRHDPDFLLQTLTCKSDVVVRGNVLASNAYLTEAETFTFTEYIFEVSQMLYGSTETNVIAVSRPGGKVKIGDLTLHAQDRSYDQLEKGSEYILFLKYLSSANGYLVTDPRADFRVQGSWTFSISPVGVPRELRDGDTNLFVRRISSAAKAVCVSETS